MAAVIGALLSKVFSGQATRSWSGFCMQLIMEFVNNEPDSSLFAYAATLNVQA